MTEKLKELYLEAINGGIIEWKNNNGNWEEINFLQISIGAFMSHPEDFRVKQKINKMWTTTCGGSTTDETLAKLWRSGGYVLLEWVQVIK